MNRRQAIGVLDLGASGGRVFVAVPQNNGLHLIEIHRFTHLPHNFTQSILGSNKLVRRHYWDFECLYGGLLDGLGKIAQDSDLELVSFGVDTWGSDGTWINDQGDMLGLVATGRDERWQVAVAEISEQIDPKELFRLTGVHSDPFCVLNQIYWFARHQPEVVAAAATYMPINSLIHYLLCGERAAEYTWMSTTRLNRPGEYDYLKEVFVRLQLPLEKMARLVHPGTMLGQCHANLANDLGLPRFRVIAPATHDTASAYVAAPRDRGRRSILVSAGTWSLVGIPVPQLLISDEIYRASLSNIGGCDETFFQAIIMGSWPAQELRRLWSAQDGEQIDWKYFDQLASSGPPLARVIDIDNEIFRSPGNMELAIREFCRRTGQQLPNHRAEMACAVYEALALKVAMACGEMQQLAEYDADEIIVLGGGSQNEIVNQWISDASGLPVRTGSANATALGNAIVQAHTLGWISSLTEGPQSIRGEYQERVFEPHAERDWEGAKRGIRIWQHQ